MVSGPNLGLDSLAKGFMGRLSLVERGVGYVLVQAILIGLIIFGPQGTLLLPEWITSFRSLIWLLGVIISFMGLLLTIVAALNLGKNLTPLPCPKENAQLVQRGLYRFVRHPIYFGVLLVACGWLLVYPYALVLVYVISLFIFFDLKTRREEIWLMDRFPAYVEYKQKVKKLIPFFY